ncbi:MAG: hypothetical protein B6242_11985 [Anaerolineaceae bacterium 4572_78]|nr:MAG: hypothetical protein B6242_11985 [Anaerolineaceae bacterium 4572_78]
MKNTLTINLLCKVKLLECRDNWHLLENSDNPFATIVMAHLQTKATKHNPDERFRQKLYLIKRLYEKGYTERDILLLFRFVDWMMALPPILEQKLEYHIEEYEGEQKMPYVTQTYRAIRDRSLEEGFQKGIKQGIQKGTQKGTLQNEQKNIVQVLNIRFGQISKQLVKIINTIEDIAKLEALFTNVITIESVEKFVQVLDNVLAESTTVSPQTNGHNAVSSDTVF